MKSKKIALLILLTMSLMNVASPVMAHANAATINKQVTTIAYPPSRTELATKFLDTTKAGLLKTESLLQIAEKKPTQKNVEAVIKAFIDIKLGIDDIEFHKDDDEFDTIFLRILEITKKLPDDVRNKEFVEFDKKLVNNWWTTFEEGYNSFYKDYIYYLSDNIRIPEIHPKLLYLYIYVINKPFAPSKETRHLPVTSDSDLAFENQPDLLEIIDTIEELPVDMLTSSISYVKEKNNYYKVTKYYDDIGEFIKTEKGKISQEDYDSSKTCDYINFCEGSSKADMTTSFDNISKDINQDSKSSSTVQDTIDDVVNIEVTPTEIPFDDLSSSLSYVKEGDIVYKLTQYFNESGVLVKTEKEKAPKEDYFHVGIYDYIDLGEDSSKIDITKNSTK